MIGWDRKMGIRQASTIQPWQQELGKQMANLFEGLGTTASGFLSLMPESAQELTAEWSETFATPVMDMWRKSVQPLLEESSNLPGAFYSKSRFDLIQREAEQFMSGSVMPTLFEAQERRRARIPQFGQIYASLLGQGSGLSTAQTLQNFYQGGNWRENLAMDISNYGSIGADAIMMAAGFSGGGAGALGNMRSFLMG